MTHREDGAALVEFAFVATLLLTLVIGMITYGLALGLNQSIVHTASAAARAGVVVTPDEVPGRVDAVSAQQLSWLGSRGSHVDTSHAIEPCVSSTATCLTVTVSYPYAEQPLVPSFLGLPLPDTLSSTAVLEMEPNP